MEQRELIDLSFNFAFAKLTYSPPPKQTRTGDYSKPGQGAIANRDRGLSVPQSDARFCFISGRGSGGFTPF